MSRLLVIIPARSGSVGVPDKNILPIQGTPLLVRTYLFAKTLSDDANVVVSTDSSHYLSLVNLEGYNDTALRPAELSDSKALVIDTILYELRRVGAKSEDLVVVLEPSFVGRRETNLRLAINQIHHNEADSCFGVYRVPETFHYAKQFFQDGLQFRQIGPGNINRQQLPPAYVRSGEFYLSRVKFVRSERSLYGGRLQLFETAEPFVNIDTPEDGRQALMIPMDALD